MKIIGHRGARGLAPENTVVSLQKALQHGVDEVEFDVRVTKDNIAVLHHDPALSDQAGNHLLIKDHPYIELKQHKPDLATLDEAFIAIGCKIPMLIELKPNEPTEPVVAIIKTQLAKKCKPSHILLGSFSQQTLMELHEALPEIQKVVIERWSGIRAVRRAKAVGTKRINMSNKWLWWGFIRSMKRGGWELYPYTLNTTGKADRWAKYGIVGVITDFPDRFEK